jgi:hypothetical protein
MSPGAADVAPPPAVVPPPVAASLLRDAAAGYVDLGYLAQDGVLDLEADADGVRSIRIEVPQGQVLQLQTLGIETAGPDEVARTATVHASSWDDGLAEAFSAAHLFDVDLPSGTLVRTRADGPGWAEVQFATPCDVRRIRLRNAGDPDAGRQARGIRVEARTRWRSKTLYDGGPRLRAWRARIDAAKAEAGADAGALALIDIVDATVRGDYTKAHRALAAKVDDESLRRWYRDAVNDLLVPRGLEWTAHGPKRPFRRWTERERIGYIRAAAEVTDALTGLTPAVCFGFGSVLAVVRDRAPIPHDDDLDIIVGFEPSEAATLEAALARVEAHLRPLGYDVTGPFAAHRHVRRPGGKPVDVFVGIFEGDAIAWYPGPRHGLTRSTVFPPVDADLLGVPCRIPAQAEAYLECLYGPGWRVPDPHFNHRWDIGAYQDIAGRAAADGAVADGAVAAPGTEGSR